MIRKKHQQSGFTLVEAILAMTIMAIAVSGVLSTFSSALLVTKAAEDYSKAAILMNELKAQVRSNMLSPMDINEGTSVLFPKLQWSVNYQETEILNLYQVDLQVQWQQGNQTYTMQNQTYHYVELQSDTETNPETSTAPSS